MTLVFAAGCTGGAGDKEAKPATTPSANTLASPATTPTLTPVAEPAVIRNEADEAACASQALARLRRVLAGTATEQDVRREAEVEYGVQSQYYFAVEAGLEDPDVRAVAAKQGPDAGIDRIRDSITSVCLVEAVVEGD